MKKKLLIALAIFGVILFAGVSVNAQNRNFHDDLIKKIAGKFNLKEGDVSSVFNEFHNDRQAERQREIEDKLSQAVKDGKITEAQKQAILKHHGEIRNSNPNPGKFRNLTREQKQEKMQAKREEMKTWAADNGLNLETLHEITGFSKGFGGRGFGMHK